MLKSANEEEAVKRLFRDINVEYNPSTLAKAIRITREGAFKLLRGLEQEGIVKSRQMGRAYYYSLALDDPYVKKIVELLLIEEARKKKKWLFELAGIFGHSQVVVMFGSAILDEKKAIDIDLLIIMEKRKNKQINKEIAFRNEMLSKRLHPIKQTEDDIIENIKKHDKVILEAIKRGIVLHGQERFVELISDARGREQG